MSSGETNLDQGRFAFDSQFYIQEIKDLAQRDAKIESSLPGLRECYDAGLTVMYYFNRPEWAWLSEFPIGATVAVHGDSGIELLSGEQNRTNVDHNSLKHAETVAITGALEKLGTKHLPEGAVLISLVEPCAMCAEAFYHAGGQMVVYSLSQRDVRGMNFNIRGEVKPFRAEPKGYSIEKFFKSRDPRIRVVEHYRMIDALRFISPLVVKDTNKDSLL